MKLKTLQTTNLQTITNCFNLAFSDYFIKNTVTPEYLKNRWAAAGVDMSLSIGVFDEDKMVGFAIHAVGQRKGQLTAFDVGAGVVPSHRGQRLVQQMYAFITPIFKDRGITQGGLEVIQENFKAIKAYQRVGFTIDRSLKCYKGSIKTTIVPNSVLEIREMNGIHEANFKACYNFLPPWENTIDCLKRNQADLRIVGLYENEQWCGYCVIKGKGAVKQFGILPTHRRRGLGTFLFTQLAQEYSFFTIVNIDSNDVATIQFLEKFGLENFINQYEMYWQIEKM